MTIKEMLEEQAKLIIQEKKDLNEDWLYGVLLGVCSIAVDKYILMARDMLGKDCHKLDGLEMSFSKVKTSHP